MAGAIIHSRLERRNDVYIKDDGIARKGAMASPPSIKAESIRSSERVFNIRPRLVAGTVRILPLREIHARQDGALARHSRVSGECQSDERERQKSN